MFRFLWSDEAICSKYLWFHCSFWNLVVDDQELPTMLQLNHKQLKTDPGSNSNRTHGKLPLSCSGNIALLSNIWVETNRLCFQFKDGYPLIQSASFVRRVQNALQNLGYSYPPNIKNTVFYQVLQWQVGFGDFIIQTMEKWKAIEETAKSILVWPGSSATASLTTMHSGFNFILVRLCSGVSLPSVNTQVSLNINSWLTKRYEATWTDIPVWKRGLRGGL